LDLNEIKLAFICEVGALLNKNDLENLEKQLFLEKSLITLREREKKREATVSFRDLDRR
jgi:hypothetical protein